MEERGGGGSREMEKGMKRGGRMDKAFHLSLKT